MAASVWVAVVGAHIVAHQFDDHPSAAGRKVVLTVQRAIAVRVRNFGVRLLALLPTVVQTVAVGIGFAGIRTADLPTTNPTTRTSEVPAICGQIGADTQAEITARPQPEAQDPVNSQDRRWR